MTDEERAALQAELDALNAARTAALTGGSVIAVRDPDGHSAQFAPVNEAVRQARIDYLTVLLSTWNGARRLPLLVRY